MTKRFCDKCRKEIPGSSDFHRLRIYRYNSRAFLITDDDDRFIIEGDVDICEDCLGEIMGAMGGGDVKQD